MVKKVKKKLAAPLRVLKSRPPLARMMQLHERLRTGAYPNCRSLSQDLEVSPKTIQRDIDFMRDQLGLPIEYDDQRFGFYYTGEVMEFPAMQVSEGELMALFVAQKALRQYQGTSFERPLTAAFQKLTEGMRDEVTVALKDWDTVFSFKGLGPSVTDLAQFEALSRSIRSRQSVSFQYKKLNSRRHEARQCDPYHLACVEQQWYLFGRDTDRNAVRTYALTRMQELVPLERRFPDPGFKAQEYLRQSFGVFSGDREYRIRIRFDSFGSQLVRERIWHPTQMLEELPDGNLILQMRLGSLPEVERWILSWGSHAEALEPNELRQSVKARIQEALVPYRSSRGG
ncbi:MAG: helix-turn-helix transcriptional regulator [Candidatus Methylacidiphilales bacterium]